MRVGSRAQVWHGTACMTSGGLEKKNLTQDKKTGRIISIRRQALGRKAWANMDPATKAKFKENAEKNRFQKGGKKAAAPAKKKAAAPAKKKAAAPAKKKKAAAPAKKAVKRKAPAKKASTKKKK